MHGQSRPRNCSPHTGIQNELNSDAGSLLRGGKYWSVKVAADDDCVQSRYFGIALQCSLCPHPARPGEKDCHRLRAANSQGRVLGSVDTNSEEHDPHHQCNAAARKNLQQSLPGSGRRPVFSVSDNSLGRRVQSCGTFAQLRLNLPSERDAGYSRVEDCGVHLGHLTEEIGQIRSDALVKNVAFSLYRLSKSVSYLCRQLWNASFCPLPPFNDLSEGREVVGKNRCRSKNDKRHCANPNNGACDCQRKYQRIIFEVAQLVEPEACDKHGSEACPNGQNPLRRFPEHLGGGGKPPELGLLSGLTWHFATSGLAGSKSCSDQRTDNCGQGVLDFCRQGYNACDDNCKTKQRRLFWLKELTVMSTNAEEWDEEGVLEEGIVSVRDLSHHTTQVLKAVEARGRSVFVTRHGKIVAALTPVEMRNVVDQLVANRSDIRDSMSLAEQALMNGGTVSAAKVATEADRDLMAT